MKMQTAPAQDVLNLTHPTAEITTLAAMRLSVDDAIFMADNLSSSDYTDPRRRVIFQSIVNVVRGIEPLDDTAILAECASVARDMRLDLRIDGGYLAGLEGDPLRARAYAGTVKRMAWLREAGEFAYWFVAGLQEFPDPDTLFSEAQERLQALHPPQKDKRFVYGSETVSQHIAVIDQRIKDALAGVVNPYNWPWASWAADVRPLRPGMVGVIAAPDGQGKTTYMECIAEHWAKGGLNVVYVHLEDELEYKLDRRLARWARVAMSSIEDGKFTPLERDAIRQAQNEIDRLCPTLHYYHAPGLSMADIVRELESKVAEGVCQAVCFDYLDKVQPSRSQEKLFGSNTWERQSADVEALKVFAEKHHVPVVTATQGNKAMQEIGAIQTRRNISGSGGKTQKAQLVIILTRDLVGSEGLRTEAGVPIAEAGEYSPFVNVRIDKQNRGKTGVTITQYLVGKYFDIRDIIRSKAN
jgi:replicative DNA helicase